MILINYEVRNHHSAGYSLGADSYEGDITMDALKQLLGEMVLMGNFKGSFERFSAGQGRTKDTDYPSYHLEILDWDHDCEECSHSNEDLNK
jgi:hypothetical protein